MKQEYRDLFSSISQPVERDVYKFINRFNLNVLNYADLNPVEELSEIVQNSYQEFANRMEVGRIYTGNAWLVILFINYF